MMDFIGNNPLTLLTFLVAPAILTNASSIMVLATSNRFGLAIDRVKSIVLDLEIRTRGSRSGIPQRLEHLKFAQRRVLLIVRALTTLYVSVGSFVAATLIALLGALIYVAQQNLLAHLSMLTSLLVGVTGVTGLVTGCVLLIRESRMALYLLTDETNFLAIHDHTALMAPPQSSMAISTGSGSLER